MNIKLPISLLFFSALILGCSSGGSSSSKPDEPVSGIPSNPIEGETQQPIEKDKGYKVDEVNGIVYLDGEVLGTIEDHDAYSKRVVDAEGNHLAYITQTGEGYRIVIADSGGSQLKDHYYIKTDDQGKWTIDWVNSVVDYDWGVGTDDIEGRPDPHTMTVAQKKAAFKKKLQSVRDRIKAKKLKR